MYVYYTWDNCVYKYFNVHLEKKINKVEKIGGRNKPGKHHDSTGAVSPTATSPHSEAQVMVSLCCYRDL